MIPLTTPGTLANPDLATLVATRKCGLGGLHFLRPAGGELCMWWSLWCLKFKSLGFARAWFMELQQGPGLAGVYLTQTAQKILPGGYAHSQLPPHVTPARLLASFEPLNPILGGTPDRGWNPS